MLCGAIPGVIPLVEVERVATNQIEEQEERPASLAFTPVRVSFADLKLVANSGTAPSERPLSAPTTQSLPREAGDRKN